MATSILHLDMDAFFASVEQMDNPALVGQPVIVGGDQRGVVATASYEARTYGIHSAMPIASARKLCPHGVYLRGRGARYSEISQRIMAALADFSPLVQPASIDEAYADLSGLGHIFGNIEELALTIKKRVFNVTGGLTCSIGIAPVKFLAKICSDINKPDGLYILEEENMDEFLLALPVDKLPGVGSHMSQSLRNMGITRVSALRQLTRQFLQNRFGKWGLILHDRAWGIDPRPVHGKLPAKSESAERTFMQDLWSRSELNQELLGRAEKVGAALRKQGLAGRVITLKIKYANFQQITRSRSLPERTSSTREIYQVASDLLAEEELKGAVRLLGISVSGFEPRQSQHLLPGLEAHGQAREAKLDQTLDALREKFGKSIIQRGRPYGEQVHHFEKKSGGKQG